MAECRDCGGLLLRMPWVYLREKVTLGWTRDLWRRSARLWCPACVGEGSA